MPTATPASIRSWKGRQSGCGLAWTSASGLMADLVSASGLAVVAFMAPACCRERGPAIGKTPGSTLMIRREDQGSSGWPARPIWRDDRGMEEQAGWPRYRHRRHGLLGWRGPRGSGPLRRRQSDRLAGGVAAGLASPLGFGGHAVGRPVGLATRV